MNVYILLMYLFILYKYLGTYIYTYVNFLNLLRSCILFMYVSKIYDWSSNLELRRICWINISWTIQRNYPRIVYPWLRGSIDIEFSVKNIILQFVCTLMYNLYVVICDFLNNPNQLKIQWDSYKFLNENSVIFPLLWFL